MSPTAEAYVYEGKDGWRWRIKAANGEVVATGESHTRKEDAERALATVLELAHQAYVSSKEEYA
jgi:uncharacterized protein YegP (UPF0339 family)